MTKTNLFIPEEMRGKNVRIVPLELLLSIPENAENVSIESMNQSYGINPTCVFELIYTDRRSRRINGHGVSFRKPWPVTYEGILNAFVNQQGIQYEDK